MTSRASRSSPFADRVVAALAAAAVFLVAWGLVHRGSGRTARSSTGRPTHSTAASMRDGLVPYRDFAVEYPPGALPVFVLPSLVARRLRVVVRVADGAVRRAARRRRRVAAAGGGVLRRARAAARRLADPLALRPLAGAARDGVARAARCATGIALGWALLGAAVAAKLWPLVLVPLALVWSVRRGRPCGAARRRGRASLAVALPFAVVSPARALGRASAARRRVRCRSRASAPRS